VLPSITSVIGQTSEKAFPMHLTRFLLWYDVFSYVFLRAVFPWIPACKMMSKALWSLVQPMAEVHHLLIFHARLVPESNAASSHRGFLLDTYMSGSIIDHRSSIHLF
jgi:hypothetical protein